MTIKGSIQPDHIPVNKYTLFIIGLLPITFTSVSGLEKEVPAVDLPDSTRASGGTPSASELTCMMPMHHTAERLAMELWFGEGQDPVTSTYKKPGTLIMTSGTGGKVATYSLLGTWVSKRKLPDLAMDNDGDMAVIEWTLQVDDVTLIT